MSDTSKVVMATVLAGSLGGLGGHTIGNGTEVNSQNIDSCHTFIEHARNHVRHECDIEKLKLKMDC